MKKISDENMTTIMRVISIHAPRYNVIGYEEEDIKQEAFIICMKILDHWDGVRPLENFLVRSLSNRLKTLVRDKHKLQGGFAEANQKILSPIDIDNVDWDTENALIGEDVVSLEIEYRDLLKKIDENLPVTLRRDYLLMRDGIKINRGRQEKIRNFISNLIDRLEFERNQEDLKKS